MVLDQCDDTELTLASDTLVAGWFATWQNFAQGPALPEEEPSVEQLTALHARVITISPPSGTAHAVRRWGIEAVMLLYVFLKT